LPIKGVDSIAEIIESSKRITALTGAGVSTNAGIPDFRGEGGLYSSGKYDPDKVFDIDYFVRDPAPFYQFARDFLALLKKAEPTRAHLFLAELERQGRLKTVITQNIDGLHKRAGSKNVIELHGSFEESHCMSCGKEYSVEELERMIPERCGCGGIVKPDIVFFGEPVKCFNEARVAVESSDLLLVLGSSLAVAPASMLPYHCRGRIIIVNKGPVFAVTGGAVVVNEDLDSFLRSLPL
jgi:NAD-dependent deacetylase